MKMRAVNADAGDADGPDRRVERDERPGVFERPVHEARRVALAAPLVQTQHEIAKIRVHPHPLSASSCL